MVIKMNKSRKKKREKLKSQELKLKFKAYCAIRNKSMKQVIEEMMRERIK